MKKTIEPFRILIFAPVVICAMTHGYCQTIVLKYDAYGNRLSKSFTGNVPKPQISGDSIVCQGATANLFASGGTAYRWNDGSISTSISVVADSSRTYSVTAYNQHGCAATVRRRLTVNAVPKTGAIVGDSIVYVGTTDTFSVPLRTGSVYYWTVTGGHSILGPNSGNQVCIQWGNNSGPDTVRTYEYLDINRCTTSSVAKHVAVRQSTAVNGLSNGVQHFAVHPNPTSSGASVSIQLTGVRDAQIIVTDIQGRQLAQKTVSGSSAYEVSLEQSIFPVSGIYFVRLSINDGASFTQKIQVNR